MSMELDRICTVDISLATPISDNASFDNILILGPAPAKPKGSIEAVAAYSGLDELTALGVVATGENADPVGVAARVAFSQSPKPHDVYVAFLSESDSGGNITPALTAISSIMEHALAVSGWYCVCPVGLDDAKVKEVIQWTETQNKLCGYIDDDPESPIVEAGLYLRSFPFFPKETADQSDDDIPAENKYGAAVAVAVKAMNYHAGEETWALMPVSGISPAKLTSAYIKKLEAANFSFVMNAASKNITQGGKTNGGEWIRPIGQGIEFVGYRVWPHHANIRKSTTLSIKRNLKGVQHRYRVGKIPLPRALSTVKGYVGMLQKVDSQELIDKICAETVLVRAEEAA